MVDVLAALMESPNRKPVRSGLDSLLEWFSLPNGQSYAAFPFTQTFQSDREVIGSVFEAYVQGGLKGNGIVFALERFRVAVFAEARPTYRGVDGKLFSTPSLRPLHSPSPGRTGRQLRSRALLEADLSGNHFAVRQIGSDRIITPRPDWVTIMLGSNSDLDPSIDPGADFAGILYHPGGIHSGNVPIPYLAEEVAHWAPNQDPVARFRGMSWLTPVLREITADIQATVHKQKFFENGATPNMVVTLDSSLNPDTFKQWVEIFNEKHQGAANAYKTLFLGGGADVDVVGKDFQQLDFRATQGAGEARIAIAAGVHPSVIGLIEGLQGSSLNAGNYTATRRTAADSMLRPLWGDYFETMSKLVTVPRGAELWYDDRDIEFLQEDQKDNAEIQSTRAQSIRTLTDAGYESESVVEAVVNDDMSLLTHSGLFSVQLQEAGISPTQEPNDD